jgi:foldase protein PrsA
MLSIKWKKFSKGIINIVVVMAIASIAVGCGSIWDNKATSATATDITKGDLKEILVTYKDGGQVTRGQFNTFLNINSLLSKQSAKFKDDIAYQQNMMKQLVTFKVLSSRADDKMKTDSEANTKKQMEKINFLLSAQEGGMKKQLKDADITATDIEQLVLESTLAIALLESKVTDQQIQEAYNKQIAADKSIYDVATLSHILIITADLTNNKEIRTKEEALKRAKEVQNQLNNGGDFVTLSKEYSEDPGSKDKGGKFENINISQLSPEFKKAAAELPLNQVSDPVETTYGYHVIKVESRKSKTMDEVKPNLRSELAEAQENIFLEKELPSLIEINKLPIPPPEAPAEAPKVDVPGK